jgi:hypothetical protein
VFGNPLTPPYIVNRNTYAIAPYYIWQTQRTEPSYRHKIMQRFYREDELNYFVKIHTLSGFLPQTLCKVGWGVLFFSGIALLPPLVMLRRVLLDGRIRFLVLSMLVMAGGLLIEIFYYPHYVAPFTAVFYAIGIQAMRHLRLWSPEGKPVGRALVRLTVALCFVMAGLRLYAEPLHFKIPAGDWSFTWYGPGRFGMARALIEGKLEQFPGKQLVLVRYSPEHDPLDEWVYNAADIDGSKIIWAREMDAAGNLELIHYYKDRYVWLVQPDLQPVELSPYLYLVPEQVTTATK